MRILYFDFCEARIIYGSAASLKLSGHDVFIIESSRSLESKGWSTIDVEVGNNIYTKKVILDIYKTPILPHEGLNSRIIDYSKDLIHIVDSINPDIIIAGANYWLTAKRLALKLKKPLIFWNIVLPGIFKLPLYIKEGKIYSLIPTTPLGFIHNIISVKFSNYTINNDLESTKIFNRMHLKNVETVWPTYTKFLKKDAYAAFIKDNVQSNSNFKITNQYVLSMILVDKRSHLNRINLKSLKFIKNVALKTPEIDFIIVGASLDDIDDSDEYKNIKNIKLLGKIFDDNQIADLYRNSCCVLCPIYLPGFSNRLFEPFFYNKTVISTYLPLKYHAGISNQENILLCKDPKEASSNIKKISNDSKLRKKLENNVNNLYNQFFSPEKHVSDMEKIFSMIRS